MRDNKKQHTNKHTFPEDIAEMIKPRPGMGPVFDSDSKPLMQRLKEARELIESGNLTEEERIWKKRKTSMICQKRTKMKKKKILIF